MNAPEAWPLDKDCVSNTAIECLCWFLVNYASLNEADALQESDETEPDASAGRSDNTFGEAWGRATEAGFCTQEQWSDEAPSLVDLECWTLQFERNVDYMTAGSSEANRAMGKLEHELRTPLAAARATLELLLGVESIRLSDTRGFLASLHAEVLRVVNLLNGAMDAAWLNLDAARVLLDPPCRVGYCGQAWGTHPPEASA